MSTIKSPNWKTTAASLKLSEKLELSEDGLKVSIGISFKLELQVLKQAFLKPSVGMDRQTINSKPF